MDDKRRKWCQNRKAALLAIREPYLSDWQQVADYIDPYAGKYLRQTNGTTPRKLPSRSKIINSSASKALRGMDAGFMGGHTSKSRPWFRIGITNPALAEDESVKVWLDDLTQSIRDVLARSNFYTAMPKLHHARHLFGVGAMIAEADDEDVIRFYVRSAGTYAIGVDYRGRCDAFWYTYPRTADQLRKQYPESSLPPKVLEALRQNKPDTQFQIESLIERNPDAVEGASALHLRPWRQTYWIDGAPNDIYGCLDENGYYKMPVMAPRWMVEGSDVYGTSPAIEALGDIKQLQFNEGSKALTTDLITRPPLGLPESMRSRNASLAPGARTFLTPDQVGIRAEPMYVVDARAKQELRLDNEEVETRVQEAFYADLFRMLSFLDDKQRTAYEISARQEEKIAQLGPALETLDDEMLDPVVELLFDEMSRRGMIPDPPPALDNVALKIEYTSILAQAQKAIGSGTIERVIGFVGQAAQFTGDPSILTDNIDMDATIEAFHDAQGAPARMLRSDDAKAAIRQARQQQMQMQQMAAMMPAMKQGMDAAKSAAETVPQDNSLLTGLGGLSQVGAA
jgi:hypothetical protein